MRVVIASCSVDYSGRLDAHLPRATRLIMVKADGSVLVHSDGGSYKPLNWMSPPARLSEAEPDEEDREAGVVSRWEVRAAKTDDRLIIRVFEVFSDTSADLGVDPGLTKDGVEAHLQELLAEQIEVLGAGWRLVRREYPTAIGPVDIMARDADGGSYKPLNWMSPPARLAEVDPDEEDREIGVIARWEVSATRTDDRLVIRLFDIVSDTSADLGVDPGLTKDGVEAHLQELLAERVEVLGSGWRLVRREYPTPLGPVDLLVRDESGAAVAVEVKRVGGIDGVEQLTRYVDMLDRDPLLTPVRGLFAAQQIRPQARVLAEDRGIRCVVLDYDALRGLDDPSSRLF